MSLSAPLGLLLLGLAAPVVFFFLRRPPVPTRSVSSLLLARALASMPQRPRRLPRSELFPLALILGALLAMVGAITLRLADSSRPVVVVLETRAPSPLTDPATVALARSRIRALASQRPGVPFSVVTTAPAGLAIHPTTDLDAVLRVLDAPVGTQPGAVPTDLLEHLCRREAPTFLVVGTVAMPTGASDCPQERIPVPPADGPTLLELVATAPSSTGDVWLHLKSSGAQQADLRSGDRPVGTIRLDGEAPGEGIARVSAPPGAPLTVTLDGRDQAGAAATIGVPALTTARTLVRTEQPDGYLAQLARLHPRLQATIRGPGTARDNETWDLVLTDASAPVEDRGKVIAIFGHAAPGWSIPAGPRARRPTLAVTAPDAALLDLVDLSSLHVDTITTLVAPPDATILASTELGPVAVQRSAGTATLAVFAMGPDNSDLALRTDFVHLVANLVDLAAPAPAPPPPTPTRGLATEMPLPTATRPGSALTWGWLTWVALGLLAAESLWLLRRDRWRGGW